MCVFVLVWVDVRENPWIQACGQETSSFLVYWEVMPQSVGCLSQSCCPLVCEGFIIELAQALWRNIGGMLSSYIAMLAHYLWKRVRKNLMWTCVYFLKMLLTWDDVCIFVGENSDVCAFEIQIHPLLYCHRVTLPCYCMRACMCVCVMGLAGC